MVHVCWFMDYIMLRYPGILREESEQQRLNYT